MIKTHKNLILGFLLIGTFGCSKAYDKEVKVEGAVLGEKVVPQGDSPAPDSFRQKTLLVQFKEGEESEQAISFSVYQPNLISDLSYELVLPSAAKNATHRLEKVDAYNYSVLVSWNVPEYAVPRTSDEILEKATLIVKAKSKSGVNVERTFPLTLIVQKNILRPEILGVISTDDYSKWEKGHEKEFLEKLSKTKYQFATFESANDKNGDPIFEMVADAKAKVFENNGIYNKFYLIVRDPEAANPDAPKLPPIPSVVGGLDAENAGKYTEFQGMISMLRSEEDPSVYYIEYSYDIDGLNFTSTDTEKSYYMEVRSQHSPNIVSKRFQFFFDILDTPLEVDTTIGGVVTFLAEVRNTYQFRVFDKNNEGKILVKFGAPCGDRGLRCTCEDQYTATVSCSVEWTPSLNEPSISLGIQYRHISDRPTKEDTTGAFGDTFLKELTAMINEEAEGGKDYPLIASEQTQNISIRITNPGGKGAK